jgi:hypothetical protein
MNWRLYLLLTLLGLAVVAVMASLQVSPGYMDADYYYAGGMQLVTGHGFTEPYIWNYLDNPAGLPHPSNVYWMPMASLVAAFSALILGSGNFSSARVGFLLIAAMLPPLTAALAWSFTSRRDLSLASGLLALFPAFYLVFLPTTDTFGLYMLFGGLFFLVLSRRASYLNPFILGLLAGLMHLTRADGLLWLLIALFSVCYMSSKSSQGRKIKIYSSLLLTLGGYLLVMTPWFIRNYHIFRTPLAPGASKMLWLTSYDQLFSYPASQITIANWWASGLNAILRVRTWALGLNLANALSVQWEVFLLPLIAVGLWHLRRDKRVHVAVLSWLITLVVMTVAFPFAGARGGFFHSGAAIQTMWWVLATVGLERVIVWGKQKRGWDITQAGRLFYSGLVILALLISIVLVYTRVLGGGGNQPWDMEQKAYSQINGFLTLHGMSAKDVVIVANPPGFYITTGNPAIAVPDGDIQTLITVARKYEAKYLILEATSTPSSLMPVYLNPENQSQLSYLGDVEGAHIYGIRP